jgi:hypothetical protein
LQLWRLTRLGPVPEPPQKAERSLAQDPASEQGCPDDREQDSQFGADEDLTNDGMQYPKADRGSQRPGADGHRVPSALALRRCRARGGCRL